MLLILGAADLLPMPSQSQTEYICEYDNTHVAVTPGSLPDGWVQLVPSWDTSAYRYFDTVSCLSTWYTQNTPL